MSLARIAPTTGAPSVPCENKKDFSHGSEMTPAFGRGNFPVACHHGTLWVHSDIFQGGATKGPHVISNEERNLL
jgi:hypothetical protein